MIDLIKTEIKMLLDSDLTSYEIGKISGVSHQVIVRYRKGDNEIDNMTLKTANKLLKVNFRNENIKETLKMRLTQSDEMLSDLGSVKITFVSNQLIREATEDIEQFGANLKVCAIYSTHEVIGQDFDYISDYSYTDEKIDEKNGFKYKLMPISKVLKSLEDQRDTLGI